MVIPILERRMLEEAKKLIHPDTDNAKMIEANNKVLQKYPQYVELWRDMCRAGEGE